MLVPGVPEFVTPNAKLVIQYAKHHQIPFYARGVKGELRFDKVRFKSAGGIAINAWDFETLYLDVEGRGDGYLSCNAGPVNVFNGQRIVGPGIRWYGSGDDVFNPRTRSWQGNVPTAGHEGITPDPFPGYAIGAAGQGWDASGWIDVMFNSPYGPTLSNAVGNSPTTPAIGDIIEISLPNTPVGERTRTVKSLAASPKGPASGTNPYTRVTFVENSLPPLFDPATCRIINRSTVPVVDLDRISTMACGGRTIVCQSHDMRIGTLVAIGTRLSNILATSSSGGEDNNEGDTKLGDGGFKGGLHIGRYIARHSTLDALATATTDVRALLRVEAKAFDQTSLAAPSGWPQVTIGFLDADDYPYTAFSAEGIDVAVGGRSVRNGGTRRFAPGTAPVPDPTPGHGNFDYSARNSAIRLEGDNAAAYLETKEEDAVGGQVVLNIEPGSAPPTLTVKSGEIVIAGSNYRVDVGTGTPNNEITRITGGIDGQLLILRAIVATRPVTVRGGVAAPTGNIALLQGGDVVLGGTGFPHLLLMYSAGGAIWREVTRPPRSLGLATYTTDADTSFAVSSHPETILVNAAFGAMFRNLVLLPDKATRGDKFRISNTRVATPAATAPHIFNGSVSGTTDLFTLVQGKWADVIFDGTNWLLVASGLVKA